MKKAERKRSFRARYPIADGSVVAILLLLFLCFASLFVFLQKDFFFGTEPESPLQISVVLPNEGLLKQSALREGMEQAAFEANCELSFLAPLSPNQLEEQQALLKREWQERPDAIIVSPIRCEIQLSELEKTASSTKLCLVNVWPEEDCRQLWVAPDYREMARVLAERIVKERPGLKRLRIYSSSNDSPFDQIRPELLRRFTSLGIPDVALLNLNPQEAKEKLFSDEPLVARANLLDPSSAYLALDELSLSLLAKGLDPVQDLPFAPLFAWGLSDEGLRLLEEGRLGLLMVDDQYSAGYLAVSKTAAALRRPKEPLSTAIHFTLIDQYNKDTLANQHLLYPIVQ